MKSVILLSPPIESRSDRDSWHVSRTCRRLCERRRKIKNPFTTFSLMSLFKEHRSWLYNWVKKLFAGARGEMCFLFGFSFSRIIVTLSVETSFMVSRGEFVSFTVRWVYVILSLSKVSGNGFENYFEHFWDAFFDKQITKSIKCFFFLNKFYWC